MLETIAQEWNEYGKRVWWYLNVKLCPATPECSCREFKMSEPHIRISGDGLFMLAFTMPDHEQVKVHYCTDGDFKNFKAGEVYAFEDLKRTFEEMCNKNTGQAVRDASYARMAETHGQAFADLMRQAEDERIAEANTFFITETE